MELTKTARAKLNLSLDLTGVLPNGYHAIYTVMQTVTLGDTVTVKTGGTAGITLACGAPDVPADERNTAYKAAALFFAAAGLAPDAQITVEKRIPNQAGLGGGSADAAVVLQILNELHGFPLNEDALLKLAVQIGADVPFTLLGGTRLCLNVGEVMAPLPDFTAHAVIVKPQQGVDTAAAYRRFDEGAGIVHPNNDALLYHFARGEGKTGLRYAGNVFEQLVSLPACDEIKNRLYETGAYYAAMTGSGSACFGLFDSEDAAKGAETALAGAYPFVCRCETAKTGVGDA